MSGMKRMIDEARDNGTDAFHDGFAREQNPHVMGSVLYTYWAEGLIHKRIPNKELLNPLPQVRVLYDFFPNGETEATTPKHRMSEMERWVREHIGWRASSVDRLRCYDYFDWAILTYWELDGDSLQYDPFAVLHFRDPEAAILFKLRWGFHIG